MAPEPDPPLVYSVAARKALKPGTETVFVDLSFENREPVPRWYVLRSNLQDALEESLESALVQVCGFEETGEFSYLQAQSPKTGFVAFHLASGATLSLASFAFRARGEAAFELWDVSEILCDGKQLDLCFPHELTIEGERRVAEAFRRATRGTYANKSAEVTLALTQRWTLPLTVP